MLVLFYIHAIDETRNHQNQYAYDAFGNATFTLEVEANAIRYSGEYYDANTGLYYLRARYYNPYIGRFISEDSYWGEDDNPLSLNLYTYCHNDPVNYVDPSGHSALALLAAGAKGLVSGINKVISSRTGTKTSSSGGSSGSSSSSSNNNTSSSSNTSSTSIKTSNLAEVYESYIEAGSNRTSSNNGSVLNAIGSIVNNMYQLVNQSVTNELQKVAREVNFTGAPISRINRLNEILPSINILIGDNRITGLLHDEGRRSVLVDLYELGEALDLDEKVGWDEGAKSDYIIINGTRIYFPVGNLNNQVGQIEVNKKNVTYYTNPRTGGRVMVDVRELIEAVGGKVTWESYRKSYHTTGELSWIPRGTLRVEMEPEGTGKTTTYSSQLVDYVASKEAFRAQAYNNGKTIGYGFDFYFYLYPEVEINYNDDGVTITKEEGLRLKGIILDQSRDQINTYLDSNSLTVDQNTFDALTDLFYNRNSNQLTKEVAYAMAMKNDEEVKRLFSDFDYRYAMKYIYNGDEVESQAYVDRNPGLVTRREEEYSIYKNGYVNIP